MAESANEVESLAAQFRERFHAITDQVSEVIVGYRAVIEQTLTALVVGGNVLVEGVPGLGKTRMLLALARACDLTFRRVQFTPDLMPADITGTNMISQTESGGRTVEFVPGPVFTNLLLADEINRATPRTQSALLEAMEEHAVSAGGETRPLAEPFFVMATQNPIEQEGTYPLPEAALDKFTFKLLVDMPGAGELCQILERTTAESPPRAEQVAGRDDILTLRRIAFQVPVAPEVENAALRLVRATRREHRHLKSGAGPRALKALLLGARVRALLNERYHVSGEDIRALAGPALRHRMVLSFEAESADVTPDDVIGEFLEREADG
ncbi:MAG: AAA family ATPase [Planctomycetota bacterium]